MESIETILKLFENSKACCDCHRIIEAFICANHKSGWHADRGVTRVAIWHDSWDFVLKIDRNFDEQKYCALEAYNYSIAKEYNVERVLLPIERVAVVNGWKIYRQVKYDCGWTDSKSQLSRKLCKECKQVKTGKAFGRIANSLDHRLSNAWIARATQLYGKRFMRSLEEWTKRTKVCDLHRGNIGFYQKKPVIIDYAGYYGSFGTLPIGDEILENF